MKTQINMLQLAYPPVSNQEAEWLKDERSVQAWLKSSHLYMIGQRAEATYGFPADVGERVPAESAIPFTISAGGLSADVRIDVPKLIKLHERPVPIEHTEVELGPKFIRVFDNRLPESDESRIIGWFTTEKLLYDRSMSHPAVTGLDNHREFQTYHLHYVGISKNNDSLHRLVVKPHDKRLRILSNEAPIACGARVTDEVVLFFFEANPLRLTPLEDGDDIDAFARMLAYGADPKQIPIIADAEKAYVNLLKAKYNTIQFADYPKGKDGLYGSGLDSYGYIIGEDLTFKTDTAEIVGGRVDGRQWSDLADMILIRGDDVLLVKASGGDY